MDSLRPHTIFLLALCFTLAFSGCSRKGDDGASAFASDAGILMFIPADTPYVIAAAEGMPKDVLDKIKPVYGKAFSKMFSQVFSDAWSEMSRKMRKAGQGDEDVSRTVAVVEELATFMTPEGFEGAGFKLGARSAIYGVGLLPVIRMELTDAKKLEAFLARLEDKAGEKMPQGSVGGQSYRYLGDNEGRVILATVDDYFVVTVVPSNLTEDNLKAVLGTTLPKQNIAAAGTLGELAKEYSFTPYLAGFLDVERIAATFVDASGGVNAELLDMMDFDLSDLSDVCKSEIRRMASVMPRVVFGYNEITTERWASTAILELRDDIATGLAGLAAPVPGLGTDHGGLMSFGLGLDLLAARKFYEARLDALEADPYECELFAEFQAGVAGGRAALESPLPPIVYSIKGFLAVVDDIKGLDIASQQPPSDVDMSLLVATDNAAGLIAMGAFVSPELASLNIKPDGKAVEVALPPMGQPFDKAQVAMTDAALGLAVGNGAENRLTTLIKSDVSDPIPFISVSMDMARYYEFVGDMMKMAAVMDPTGDLTAENAAALGEGMAELASLFERFSYAVLFTANGIEMPSVITLAD